MIYSARIYFKIEANNKEAVKRVIAIQLKKFQLSLRSLFVYLYKNKTGLEARENYWPKKSFRSKKLNLKKLIMVAIISAQAQQKMPIFR